MGVLTKRFLGSKCLQIPVVNFFHENCGFMGCNVTFKSRDESIEHIREHLRLFAHSATPQKDLGASQWTHSCASEHTLKRGVHYLAAQGANQNNLEEDRDQNDTNENVSNDPYSSNQSQYSSAVDAFTVSDIFYDPKEVPASAYSPGVYILFASI